MSSSGTKSVNAVHTGKPYRKGQSKQTQRKPQSVSDCGNCTKNRSIGPELMTAKTGPIHLSSLVEIAFVD